MNSGRMGEDYVCSALAGKGYRILERNFRTRFGEIDIIASSGKYIVFVEVKTRKSGALVGPFESVTPSKQRKILSAAQYYLMKKPTRLQPRFDVAAVTTEEGRAVSMEYLTDAFGV